MTNVNKVTIADIEANIESEHYFTAMAGVRGSTGDMPIVAGVPVHHPLDLHMFCVLVLKNGFTVTGESACVDPENYSEEIGRDLARQKAVDKVWTLMGYELQTKMHNPEVNQSDMPEVEYQEEADDLNEHIPLGAVVQLKSGGPIMTVTSTNEPYVTCTYFDEYMHQLEDVSPSALRRRSV